MEDGRTAQQQGMYQVCALGVTLVISIAGGFLVGFIVKNCCPIENYFDDEEHFHEVEFDIPLEEVETKHDKGGEKDEVEHGEPHSVN